jgi:hypothetical protein
MMFAGLAPEKILRVMGKIHIGEPLVTKSRRDLIASLRPNYLKYLRRDNGDLPESSSSSKEVLPNPSQTHFVPGAPSLRIVP